jgi:hypothetical protein
MRGREFVLENAHVAQLAERVLGQDEVISSILIVGSRLSVSVSRVEAR